MIRTVAHGTWIASLCVVLAGITTAQDREQLRAVVRLIARLDGDPEGAREARAALRTIGAPAVQPLIASLDTFEGSTARVRARLLALGELGAVAAPARPHLERLLAREPVHYRTLLSTFARLRGEAPFTLFADYSKNRIVEHAAGEEKRAVEAVFGAWDVELLPSGNRLIAEFALNRVREITPAGQTVWTYRGNLRNPYDVDGLPNGNVLIADTFGGRAIEVNRDGDTVWSFSPAGLKAYDVDRMPNGHTLIADGRGERILEVAPDGEVVLDLPGFPSVHDVDLLDNGRLLVTQRTLHRVIEVDREGEIHWSSPRLSSPSDADRLPNGHTLVAENGGVRELDADGKVVAKIKCAWCVEANRY